MKLSRVLIVWQLLVVLLMTSCQQPTDKREICARYAALLDPFDAMAALDLWTEDDKRIESPEAHRRVEDFCGFYKQ
jgi:hypothetical protein